MLKGIVGGVVARKDNAHRRCSRCRMHHSLCFCALLPRLDTQTRLVLIMHRRELRKSTNTGRLASLCLPNSEVHLRGDRDDVATPFCAPTERRLLWLFPHPDAVPLDELEASLLPTCLIVPDGNWRQAARMRARIPGMHEARCVTLPNGPPSRYTLRTEAHPGHLSTLEAIARAFGILEGVAVQTALERVFNIMIGRTLWSRGLCDRDRVVGGIPPLAQRHDPDSGVPRVAGLSGQKPAVS